MDNRTLLQWLKEYFPLTSEVSIKEIAIRTRLLSEDARRKLKDFVVEAVSNRYGRISFAEIYEVAKERGIDFPRPKPKDDVQPLSSGRLVECPSCGFRYEYAQGTADDCPQCGFPFIEYLIYKNASEADRNGIIGNTYFLKLRFHQGLGEGSKTLEKPA